MRDPNRIEPMWARIAQVHKLVPDQRVSQFIMNVLSEFSEDPFYMEDGKFVAEVEKKVRGWLVGQEGK